MNVGDTSIPFCLVAALDLKVLVSWKRGG